MPIEVYAFRNNNDILYQSSSGGAFFGIVEACYRINEKERAVVVYGAAFDENFDVIHKAAHSLEECKMFMGSKYVKSNTAGIFSEIEAVLKEGKAVLFSGTPCQVAALKKRLKSNNVNTEYLYTIDLICHGTPRALFWDEYKKWIKNKYKAEITDVAFRDKSKGSKKYSLRINLSNGKVLVNRLETSVFTRLFLRRFIMTEGCYKCPYACMNREGDITLGDFWGIEKIMPDFCDEGGASEVLINSEKGRLLMEELKGYFKNDERHIKKCLTDDFIIYQNNLQRPAQRPENIDEFYKDYNEKGFCYIIRKYAGYDLSGRIKRKIKQVLHLD